MPIYEYQCKSCASKVEVLQKMDDPPLVDCAQCGQASLTKCITAATPRFAGGGYYETDEKKSGKRFISEGSCGASACQNGACSTSD